MQMIKNSSQFKQTLAILSIVLCAYMAILTIYAVKFNYNLTGFINFGSKSIVLEQTPKNAIIIEDSDGYDGQYYYYIAKDPFIFTDTYTHYENLAFRYQRIMHPLMASILSFGNAKLIPLTLILINLIFILFGTYFVIRMLYGQNLNPYLAIIYAFLSSFLLAMFRDLSEPVAMGFMVASFYYYSRDKIPLSAGLLACAILTREMLVLLIPVFVIDSFVFKKDLKRAIIMALSFLPFWGWQYYILIKTQIVGFESDHGVGAPFAAMINHADYIFTQTRSNMDEKLHLGFFILISILSFLLAVKSNIKSRDEISLSFLGFSIMPFLMTSIIWVDPWSYGRVFVPVGVFLLLSYIRTKDLLHLIPLSLHIILSLVVLYWMRIII